MLCSKYFNLLNLLRLFFFLLNIWSILENVQCAFEKILYSVIDFCSVHFFWKSHYSVLIWFMMSHRCLALFYFILWSSAPKTRQLQVTCLQVYWYFLLPPQICCWNSLFSYCTFGSRICFTFVISVCWYFLFIYCSISTYIHGFL